MKLNFAPIGATMGEDNIFIIYKEITLNNNRAFYPQKNGHKQRILLYYPNTRGDPSIDNTGQLQDFLYVPKMKDADLNCN